MISRRAFGIRLLRLAPLVPFVGLLVQRVVPRFVPALRFVRYSGRCCR